MEESQRRLASSRLICGMAAVTALVVLAALASGCGGAASGPSKGRQLYVTHCSTCHGDAGARIPSAQLDSAQFIAQLGDAGLTQAIAEGKGTMPAWGTARGGPLTDDQIRILVEYIKTGGDQGPLPTGPGRSLYARQCAGCHGDRGNRIPAADLSSSSFVRALSGDQLRQAVIDGKGTMPAFGKAKGGPLSDEQAGQVVDYVKSLGRTGASTLETSASSAAREGRDLYGKSCAGCHGEKGNRIPATPMNDQSYLQGMGEAVLVGSITNGKGTMPAYGKAKGGPLSDAQIKSLVVYVNELAGVSPNAAQTTSSAPTTDGKTLYSKNCVACHGDKGNVLSNADLSSRERIAQIGNGMAQAVADGQGAMPGFKGKLKDDEIKNVVEYVKSLSGDAGSAGASPSPSAAAASGTGAGAATAPTGGPPSIPHTTAGRDACLGCHAAGGLKPVPSGHAGRTNDMCQACHKVAASSAAASQTSGPPSIPHTLQGREGVCLSCHGAGGLKPVPATHQGRDNNTCTGCHKTASGGDTAPGGATASGTSIGGATASGAVPGGAAASGAAPSSSPAATPSASGSARPSSGIPSIPHTLQGREGVCLTCHALGGMRPVPPSHQGRTNATCTGCHTVQDGGGSVAAPASGTAPAAAAVSGAGGIPRISHTLKGREGLCLQCHGPNGIATVVPADHAGRTNEMCTMCHQSTEATSGVSVSAAPRKLGPPDVPHKTQGVENQCLGCHGPTGMHPAPTNHKDVTNQQCLNCHLVSPSDGSVVVAKAPPKAPDSHAGRSNTTCQTCHDPQFPGIR